MWLLVRVKGSEVRYFHKFLVERYGSVGVDQIVNRQGGLLCLGAWMQTWWIGMLGDVGEMVSNC